MKVTIVTHTMYTGRYTAMTLPTPVISPFFERILKSCAVTKSRFIKIKKLPPKTAALLGVIPHSEIRNTIAESAMPFTIMVTIERRRRIQISARLLVVLGVPATEKKMIAITPINNALKINKNSRSL
jgi:hypothetical protein